MQTRRLSIRPPAERLQRWHVKCSMGYIKLFDGGQMDHARSNNASSVTDQLSLRVTKHCEQRTVSFDSGLVCES